MSKDTTISAAQLTCMMICASLFSTVIITNETSVRYAADYVLASLIFAFLLILWAKLMRVERGLSSETVFEKISAAVVCVVFLINAASTAVRIGDFYSAESESSVPTFFLLILIVAVAAYALYSGIESAARFSGMAVAVCCAVIVYMTAAGADNFSAANLLNDGRNGPWDALFEKFSRFPDFLAFIALTRYVKQHSSVMKSAAIYILVAAALSSFLFMFCEGCLSDFMYETRYPFYTLAAVSEAALLKGIDAVFLIVWILTGIIKISVHLLAAYTVAKRLFPALDAKYLKGGIALPVMALSIVFEAFEPSLISRIVYVAAGVGFVCLLISRFGRNNEKIV